MNDQKIGWFEQAVDTNTVAAFGEAVVFFLNNTPDPWSHKSHELARFFVDLQRHFNARNSWVDHRYKNLFAQWMQSDWVAQDLREALIFNHSYPVWKYLLQNDDDIKYFNGIDTSRLFHFQNTPCARPEHLEFLCDLMDNRSLQCFTHFLNTPFVKPIFERAPYNEGFNSQVTYPLYFDFFDPTWNFYTNNFDSIHPQWVMGMIGALYDRNNTHLLEQIFTDPRFQKWTSNSDAFEKSLLNTPIFLMEFQAQLLPWLPDHLHFAVRRNILINEFLGVSANPARFSKCLEFASQLPANERIEHFIAAWTWMGHNHHNQESLERQLIIPTFECLTQSDFECLVQHPWMENAGPIVRQYPHVQRNLLQSQLQSSSYIQTLHAAPQTSLNTARKKM